MEEISNVLLPGSKTRRDAHFRSAHDWGQVMGIAAGEVDARHELHGFFNPRSIVLLGASQNETKLGFILAQNLADAIECEVFFVNKSGQRILGRPTSRSVMDLPTVPDLAVVAVPADSVVDAVEECAQKGIRSVLVIAAGFNEIGVDGELRAHDLKEIAKRNGIRVIGPNSSGLFNCTRKLSASIAFRAPPGGGAISLMTQSGAAVMAMYEYAMDHGIALSKLVDYGNQLDVQDFELIDYFRTDPGTQVVAMFCEGFGDGRALFDAIRRCSIIKPVIVGKVARTGAGARAAASHTGSLASEARLFEAAVRQAGGIYVTSILDLLELSKALDWLPLPRGPRVGVISASGGIAVEVSDACAEAGLELPQLSIEEQARISSLIPSFASARNPVDMGPSYPLFAGVYERCLEVMMDSPSIDGIICTLVDRGAAHVEALERIAAFVQRRRASGSLVKPVMACWISKREYLGNQNILERNQVPCFEHTARVARIYGLMWEHAKKRIQLGDGR